MAERFGSIADGAFVSDPKIRSSFDTIEQLLNRIKNEQVNNKDELLSLKISILNNVATALVGLVGDLVVNGSNNTATDVNVAALQTQITATNTKVNSVIVALQDMSEKLKTI